MRNIFQDKKWFFKDQNELMKFVGSWDGKYSSKIYEYSIRYFKQKDNIIRIKNNFKNF